MRRVFGVVALGVGLALALGACSRSAGAAGEKDPYVQLLAHTDRMIELLETNRADPDEASRELNAYQEKHGAELERLKQALGELMQREPMKAAAVSAAYGLRSAKLATLTEELAAKRRAR
jgi:hypothetical protein